MISLYASVAWRKAFSYKKMLKIYEEKVRLKPSVGLDKITQKKFSEELDENIKLILRKCNNGKYRFTNYKLLLISKGEDKNPRKICIPTIRDKLVFATLNEVITNTYNGSCKTPLPHVLINDIMENIPHYVYYLKYDIASFYASIPHDDLLETVNKKIHKKEILQLIKTAIKTPATSYLVKSRSCKKVIHDKGIPEGLSISNSLANIYLHNMDEKYAQMKDVRYYRYVDDILILLDKNNVERIKKEINEDISKHKLNCNGKTNEGFIRNGIEYLGYSFNNNRISVREMSVLKIEQSIEEILRKNRKNNIRYIEWKLNLRITGCIWDGHKYGWMFFYSQINDESLLFHLDDLVKKLCIRYKMDGKIKIKRFVRVYNEIKNALHTTKYIPDISKFDLEYKKNILSEIFGENAKCMTAEKIEYMFKKLMKKEVGDLEKDIQNIS